MRFFFLYQFQFSAPVRIYAHTNVKFDSAPAERAFLRHYSDFLTISAVLFDWAFRGSNFSKSGEATL